MSKFDEFMETVGNAANKAVNETVKFTDVTATKVKIKAEEAKLCEKYEKLGRAAYGYLESQSGISEKIDGAMKEIKTCLEKISALEKELSDKKEKYNKSKTYAGKESGEEEKESCCCGSSDGGSDACCVSDSSDAKDGGAESAETEKDEQAGTSDTDTEEND
ncbi:MAG: hypothetical protein ACI4QZ_03800 [Eubacteriales bacterium]